MSVDKYHSYELLKKSEKQNEDYTIQVKNRSPQYLIMAPHGGGIEPGTTEIAEFIAGDVHSFYTFSGTKKKGNKELHIASEQYDEPNALMTVKASDTVITIHGCEGNEQYVFLGGLNDELIKKISFALDKVGFSVKQTGKPHLAGKHPNNICNLCKTNKGIQIEISHGLRKLMFKEMDRIGRKERTDKFNVFVQTIKDVLENV